jgi:anti-sigma factor RsiW
MVIDDTDLLAYVDGHLPPERRAGVEAAAAASTEVAARLRRMRASALPYAAAFESQALQPVPAELSQRIMDLVGSHSRRAPRRLASWYGLAASFAAGTLCCALVLKLFSSGWAPLSASAAVAPWIKAVADYQQLYSRATVTNVSEDAAISTRVVSDLQANDGMRVSVPDLRQAGLSFKRIQRLSFHQQPVVQMVYLPEQGEPVALCVTPDARADEAPHAEQLGELSAIAWRQGKLGYVLLGRASAQALLDVAQRIAIGATTSLYGRRGGAATRNAA